MVSPSAGTGKDNSSLMRAYAPRIPSPVYADKVRQPLKTLVHRSFSEGGFEEGPSMRLQKLCVAIAVFAVAILSATSSSAQGRPEAKSDGTNPRTARIGVW